MGKTYTKKIEAREERLKALPRSERLAKQALIKKKEGRVLDASEKHAIKMKSEFGDIMRLWETLRTSTDPNDALAAASAVEKIRRKREKRDMKRQQQKQQKLHGSAVAAAATDTTAAGAASHVTFENDDDDDDDDESVDKAVEDTSAGPTAEPQASDEARRERTVNRFQYKYETIHSLMHILSPKFSTLAKTPRVSRVIQSMIKYGSPEHLETLFSWIAKDLAEYCNDAFAHFAVAALIRHAPHALYKKILSQLIPVLPSIITHKFGIQVVHAAYSNKQCSTLDRNILLLGVFKDSVSIMKHWPGYPVLEDILQHETQHQRRLIQRLFDVADRLVSQKDAYELPFVQRLVLAYLRRGTKHEILEMCVTLKPHLADLCVSREGALLASTAFGLLEPHARKEALRAFSGKVVELAVSKYGAPVVARLFDLVYDAQLLVKFIAGPLAETIADLINSPYGVHVLLHLFTPQDDRRERILPPTWKELNLYSAGNREWNTYRWLDSNYQAEVVEICNKPASRTHLSVLGPVARKFLQVVAAHEKNQEAPVGGETSLGGLNRLHVGLVARELLHLFENEASYATVLALEDADVTLLRRVMPKKDQKRLREETAGDDEVAGAAPGRPSSSNVSKAAVEGKPNSRVRRLDASPPSQERAPMASTSAKLVPASAAKEQARKTSKRGSGASDEKKAATTAAAAAAVSDVADDVPIERPAKRPRRTADDEDIAPTAPTAPVKGNQTAAKRRKPQ